MMRMENDIFSGLGGYNPEPQQPQEEMATDRQLQALMHMGYKGDVTGLTKAQASQYIEELRNQKLQEANVEEKPKMENKAVATKGNNQVAEVKEKNISDLVINKVNDLVSNQGLMLPKNYVAENALKSAYLKLAESNLLNTDQTSLAEALLNMCIQGLNPAKNQCYFIAYAGKVQMMRSYFGDRAVAINTGLVKDIQANVIYEGDDVKVWYENDYMKIEHHTNWENFDNPIVGAYAYAVMNDGTKRYSIMKIDRIKKSWAMSKNNTNNKLQKEFADDACKRTVIRNLVKNLFNTTLDQNLIVESYNQTTSDEYVSEEVKANSIDAVTSEQLNSGKKKIDVND